MQQAEVHITKLAATRRQICAAIRMYFAGEDELAIHTVASAAYRLLADLKAERGKEEAEDVWLASLFYIARDYRRGTLPSAVTSNSELMEWLVEFADKFPVRKDTKIEDVKLSLSPNAVRDFWNKRNKIANFLKHADRDAGSYIKLDEVDNLVLLMHCCVAYGDATPEGLGNEGFVFELYLGATQGWVVADPTRREAIENLSGLTEAKRLEFCSYYITEINSRENQ